MSRYSRVRRRCSDESWRRVEHSAAAFQTQVKTPPLPQRRPRFLIPCTRWLTSKLSYRNIKLTLPPPGARKN